MLLSRIKMRLPSNLSLPLRPSFQNRSVSTVSLSPTGESKESNNRLLPSSVQLCMPWLCSTLFTFGGVWRTCWLFFCYFSFPIVADANCGCLTMSETEGATRGDQSSVDKNTTLSTTAVTVSAKNKKNALQKRKRQAKNSSKQGKKSANDEEPHLCDVVFCLLLSGWGDVFCNNVSVNEI